MCACAVLPVYWREFPANHQTPFLFTPKRHWYCGSIGGHGSGFKEKKGCILVIKGAIFGKKDSGNFDICLKNKLEYVPNVNLVGNRNIKSEVVGRSQSSITHSQLALLLQPVAKSHKSIEVRKLPADNEKLNYTLTRHLINQIFKCYFTSYAFFPLHGFAEKQRKLLNFTKS